MKTILLLFLLSFTILASAQRRDDRDHEKPVVREASNVMYEIRREAPYLTQSQENQVMEHLRAIRQVLHAGGGDYEQATYTCVARDNDGRDPWVLSVRQGINVIRIREAAFTTKQSCENSIATATYVRGKILFCMARDNDNRDPWVLTSLQGTNVQKLRSLSWTTMSACQDVLRKVKPYKSSAVFCSARDNDGRDPFVAFDLNVDTFALTKGTENFTTIQQCNEFLGFN